MALSGSAWLLWAALYHSNPQVSSQLLGFTVVDAHRIDVTIQVERAASVEATCRVVAQSADHAVVGDLAFIVPTGGQASTIVEHSITTERPAVVAVLDGCTAPDQPQPR